MDWKDWIGKKIFVRLRTNKVYSGTVIDVDFDKNGLFYYIKIKDKFNASVLFLSSEIVEFKEEI